MLSSLVNALPESCVNLEIDVASFHSGPGNHVCETLHRVLPRMHHVRLHMAPICSRLFGTGQRLEIPNENHRHPFQPIPLPNIKTLLVNCVSLYSAEIFDNCSKGGGGVRATSSALYTSSFQSVTQALQLLTRKEGSYVPSAKLCIVGSVPENVHTFRHVGSTFIRSDMANCTAWALPIWNIDSKSFLLRTSDGRELISTLPTLQKVAEGETWKNIVGGGRLPTELLAEEGQSVLSAPLREAKLPIMDSDGWRLENPLISCSLWKNEKQAGKRLLDPEKRVGSEAFLDMRPLFEKAPSH